MSRPRTPRATADLPEGLYQRVRKRGNGRVVYYFYYDKKSGREFSFGKDRRVAISQAKVVVTTRAAEQGETLATKVLQFGSKTVAAHARWFLDEYLPTRRTRTKERLSKGTLQNYKDVFRGVVERWGDLPLSTIDRTHLAKLKDELTGDRWNRYRSMLDVFFTQAVERGDCPVNPVKATTRRQDDEPKRERLTKDHYDAIYAEADDWLKRAMRLSLLRCQRPTDLSELSVDSWDGTLWWVTQSKSESAGYGHLKIRPHDELSQHIELCVATRYNDTRNRRDNDYVRQSGECRYLIWREPEKARPAEDRQHPAQLSDRILSDAFAEIRDRLGLFKDLPEGKLPASYYEIKSLGMDLYREAGRSDEWVQLLAGHRDVKTTQKYFKRRGVRWKLVEC